MVQKVTNNVEGFKELEDRLIALSEFGTDKDSQDVMSQAIRKALKPVLAAAKEKAPYDTGELHDAIRLQVPRSHKKIAERDFRGAFGQILVSSKGKIPNKAIAAEYGDDDKAPQPFLRPALYSKQGLILTTLTAELSNGIDKRVKKLAKQERKAQGGK